MPTVRAAVSVRLLWYRGVHASASDSMSDDQTKSGHDLKMSLCATQCVAARSAESHGRAAELFRKMRLLRVHETAALPLRRGKNEPGRASGGALEDKTGAGHVSSKPLWCAP